MNLRTDESEANRIHQAFERRVHAFLAHGPLIMIAQHVARMVFTAHRQVSDEIESTHRPAPGTAVLSTALSVQSR